MWCDKLNGGQKNPDENLGRESCSCLLPDSPLNIAIKFNFCKQSLGVTSGRNCVGHSSLLEMPLLVTCSRSGQEEKYKEMQHWVVLRWDCLLKWQMKVVKWVYWRKRFDWCEILAVLTCLHPVPLCRGAAVTEVDRICPCHWKSHSFVSRDFGLVQDLCFFLSFH